MLPMEPGPTICRRVAPTAVLNLTVVCRGTGEVAGRVSISVHQCLVERNVTSVLEPRIVDIR